MSDGPTPIRDAPAPFSGKPDLDNHCTPDFILRSSDDVDFHVHKGMLKMVSGFFDDMFRLPGPAPGNADPNDLSRDGIPVLVMPEPDGVVHGLLRLAYPAQSMGQYALETADFDEIVAVHEAAYKYQFLGVQRLMNEMLQNPALVDAHPHRLFAIARLHGLRMLARAAALSTLKSIRAATPAFPEMKLLSWADAHELYDFHRLCRIEVQEIVRQERLRREIPDYWNDEPFFKKSETFVWWDPDGHGGRPCGRHIHGNDTYVPPSRGSTICSSYYVPGAWFEDHMAGIASDLHLRPAHHEVETKIRDISASDIDACSLCRAKADRHLAILARHLAHRIEESNKKLGESWFMLRFVAC
ncbi:hypothetical protein DFH09DRAFT_930616 [Mycena vulgaris]|nr:hypothetical protein DFH09DRAFT_930616 [Mycena vulgaris]